MGKHSFIIRTDNAAFDEDPNAETARILRKIADKIENGEEPVSILDINGNRVGTYMYEEDMD